MATPVIKINNVDVTADVIFSDARFTSSANGAAGTCAFRLRDLSHVYHTITNGARITLDVDGIRTWTGYVTMLQRGYFFEARDCKCPGTVPIYYRVIGSDINILFERRFFRDKTNPENLDLTVFAEGTSDQTVLLTYLDDHLDLEGDDLDISTLIEAVGTPSMDEEISLGAGLSWRAGMSSLAWNTGAIFYIDPDRKVVWTDVDTPNAPYDISDRPGAGEIGCRDLEIELDGTRLINDALVWGTGVGSSSAVFSRAQDTASITDHGRWQVGKIAGRAWKQATVDAIADVYVNGSPQSQRGGKIDRPDVRCTIFTPGFRVAQKVNVRSEVHGFEQVIPIRVIEISFPTPDAVQYNLMLSHELDEPIDLVDPRPPTTVPPRICTMQYCASSIDESAVVDPDTLIGTGGTASLGVIAFNGNYGVQWGYHDWFVYIDAGENRWQFTYDPTYRDASPSHDHRILVDYADLYDYGSGDGSLIGEGPRGIQYESQYGIQVMPYENNFQFTTGIRASQYYAVVTLNISVSISYSTRPKDGQMDLFPFWYWVWYPDPNPVVVTWGIYQASEYEDGSKFGPMVPTRLETSEGTIIDNTGTYTIGEKFRESLTTGSYTRRVAVGIVNARPATGTVPLTAYYRTWSKLEELKFSGASGDASLDISLGPWEFYPVPSAAIVVPTEPIDETAGSCTPICINDGPNCEIATRIGMWTWKTTGRYVPNSTQVSADGVQQRRGVDYTESNNDLGYITFDSTAFGGEPPENVYVCYLASSFTAAEYAFTASTGVLQPPITSGGLSGTTAISGTFGPQSAYWPSAIWHGVYYPHFHNGVDWAVGIGTPVYAAARGRVAHETQAAGGNMIHIYHDAPDTPIPMRTTYAHLSSRVAASGSTVTKGQLIGFSGDSGNVSGAHLHWGLVIYGSPENPLAWTTSTTPVLPTSPEIL